MTETKDIKEKETQTPTQADKKKGPPSREDLQAKIKELEAKVAAGEEAAMKRVCKALDINPDTIKPTNVTTKAAEPIISCYVPTPVRVNMNVYHGKVEVPASTFQVIQQALGDRRMRLLKELTGNKYVLQELVTGGYAPRLVEQYNAEGDRIA